MATRKYNGPKHHSRRYQSNDNNRRRLSKQEEIDLTLEAIDLKEETNCNNDIRNNISINVNNNETTVAPITIHVNSVEDKCDAKLVVENEKCDNKEIERELAINEITAMHNSNSNSGQSSLGLNLNINESNSLLTGDNKEKKRGKQLTRAEAVRDTSMSPPPQNLESEEKNSNMLTVISTNSQSQTGPSMSSQSHKSKVKAQGSSHSSLDRSSPCLSRDSSTENYSDSTGTDLQQFLTDTLQKNKKDRLFLLKIEQDLTQLVKDTAKLTLKFNQMSSYNRMLVHRMAAFYGFEHNVDSQGTSVVVNKTKNTRIPDLKFKDHIKDELSLHEPKKSILKRDSASLEDGSTQVSFDGKERSPDRQTGNLSDGSRSKSFEEREERYEKARARIFNQDSSSSTEGNDGTVNVILDNNGSNNFGNNLIQSNSSLRSSQEDLPSNWTTDAHDQRVCWSSTDSDSSGRLHKSESKPIQQSVELKPANSSDSDTTPKSTTLSSSSSSCGMSLLTPDGCIAENSSKLKNKPTVTKASSFSGISQIVENSSYNNCNSNTTRLSKSGSLNVTQSATQNNVVTNNSVNSNIAITPKTNIKQENAHKPQFNNIRPAHHHHHHQQQQQQQRSVASQQPPQHQISSASHQNRQTWHQNTHSRNDRMASIGNVVQWPAIVHQNYPQFLLHQQSDSNVNQMKDNQYLQSGQYFVSPVSNYGQQSINNEQQQQQQQHLTQQHIRLVYPNQPQLQNFSSLGTLVNNSVQAQHQTVSNQINQVPYQIQSSQSGLNFSANQSNIQNNSTGFNQVIQSPSITHSYGAPLQVPSGVGTFWIINNGVQQNSSTPLMPCPPPANTPPTPPIGANIAPFVGMSYQQYRPAMNSAPNLNLNLGISAAQVQSQNRPQNSLLKTQSLLSSQVNTQQRILTSNGNHFIQQVPELVDINLLGANNYVNRASVPPNPQFNQMFRRMPLNPNQALDVRLIGSQQSSPFLLPTPQRPFYPLSNSINVNRYANANQRSKNTFAKYNNKQRNNSNNKNVLVPNTSTNGPNT